MKKKITLSAVSLMFIGLLSGCGNQTSFEEADFIALQKGFRFEVLVQEKVDGSEKSYRIDTAHQGDSFSYIQYKDMEGTEKQYHECYVKQDGSNQIFSTRLDVANEVHYYPVYNPATSEYYTWNDGYENVFGKLAYSDFSKEDNHYVLSADKLTEVSSFLITQVYGNPGLVLDTFSLYVKNKNISLNIEASFKVGDKQYAYTFDASVVEKGDTVRVDATAVPFEAVSDASFEQMLTTLKSHNWTATTTNYEQDSVTSSSILKSNEDKFYYSFPGTELQAGFYVTDENLVQEVTHIDGEFYRVGEPMEGSLDEIRSPFHISRACFDLVDGTTIQYKMKNVEGDLGTIYPLYVEADTLSDFVITIETDQYIFENRYGDVKTTIVFNQLGTTDVGFNKDTVKDYVEAVTWASILDADSYAFVLQIASEESLNALPVPSGYETSTWIQFSEEPESALLWAEGKSTLADDLVAYGEVLAAAGYTASAEGGPNGGSLYIKDALAVEILEFEMGFAIVIMNA